VDGTPLLDRRFVVISGKGGVGRTTVAAAFARAAVGAGKRVLLAQMQSPDRLARALGHPRPIGAEVTSIDHGLDAVNMTPKESLHQYALMVLRYERVYRALFDNRAVRGFLGAVPGLDAYSMLGKAWWHTTEVDVTTGRRKYDLVVLDAPASGHATTLFKIPQAIMEAMPKGPLARDAEAMRALFCNPTGAAFVIVTLAEELPALETAELAREVKDRLRMPLGPLVVNCVPSARVTNAEITDLLRTTPVPSGDERLDPTLAGAALMAERRRYADAMLARLRTNPGLPIVELPALPTTDLGPSEVAELAMYFTRESLETTEPPHRTG
jgi:hypothetical protein